MDGILLVDKPAGWTSFDVVAKVRGLLREAQKKDFLATHYSLHATPSSKVKVGHTGTLDPMATGLMILVLGKYTKRAAEFSKLDKTYEAELTLGKTSTTGDREGKITQKSTHQPSREDVESVLNTFVGEINQVPPAYSAIKVGGQRAYKLARAGKGVVIQPRKVQIYSITNAQYDYPVLRFTTEVSSGTYIRTLAEDIGQVLNTGAYLSALCRTTISEFQIDKALDIDNITAVNIIKYLQK